MMKVDLSVSSLAALEKKLRTAAKNMRKASDEIIDQLLEIGEITAEANILEGTAADGNTDIYVDTVKVIGAGKLNMIGDDVAYQEFGYGLVGKIGRNPKQPAEYEQGQRTEWVYVEDGKKRWSFGMEAQMPMYKASKEMRNAMPSILKKVVSEAVKLD